MITRTANFNFADFHIFRPERVNKVTFVSNLLIFYSNYSKLSIDVKLELIYAYKKYYRISFRNEEI